jgi:hypothetical protein
MLISIWQLDDIILHHGQMIVRRELILFDIQLFHQFDHWIKEHLTSFSFIFIIIEQLIILLRKACGKELFSDALHSKDYL